MKYAVGDKVKIMVDYTSGDTTYPPAGTEGVVVGVLDGGFVIWPFYVKFEDYNSSLSMDWDKGFDDTGTFALSAKEIEHV